MNTTWTYDQDTGRYIVRNARIMFPNFSGDEQDFNPAGKRNFRLQIPEDLANEMKDRGINVREREPRDDSEERIWHMKIGIYRDADIRLASGSGMVALEQDNFDFVDKEFRKAHVKNGEIAIEFHVSQNTRIMTSAPYARLDTAIIPIRKSRLLEEYGEFDDEDLPM